MVKRHNTARQHLIKSTKLDRFFAPSWIVLGHTFTEHDAHDQAISAYRKAVGNFPGYHAPLLCLGMEYIYTNNFAVAEKYIKRSIEIFDKDPMAYNELATIAYHRKDYEKSVHLLNKAISLLSPDSYELWETTFLNLGHSLRKLRRFKDSMVAYEQAFSISPRDPAILASIGFLHHLLGELSGAPENLA